MTPNKNTNVTNQTGSLFAHTFVVLLQTKYKVWSRIKDRRKYKYSINLVLFISELKEITVKLLVVLFNLTAIIM